jgi:hypothetical protein
MARSQHSRRYEGVGLVLIGATHGMQSDFYKPTIPYRDGRPTFHLFSIQDVNYHARLKRNIGGLYTKLAVSELEPQIDNTVLFFMQRLGDLTKNGPAVLNMSLWLHLFAFDSLGDLNLSKRFGFLETGADVRHMIDRADKVLHVTGLVWDHRGMRSTTIAADFRN